MLFRSNFRFALFDPPSTALSADLESQRLRWEAYQCQDLFQVAAASLLAWSISIMGETDDGARIPEIQDAVETRLAQADNASASVAWSDLRDAMDIEGFAWREVWSKLTGRRGSPEEKSWDAVRLIASLHRRVAIRTDLAGTMRKALPINGQARSIATELRWFEGQNARSVADVIGEYVVQRVVLRHSWVAMQKLRRQRDYTFLFEARDGRLVRRAAYQPVSTTPRLAPAIQFLEDVHLVSADGLTARGRALLGANR